MRLDPQFAEPTSITAVSAGLDYTCAITNLGGIMCWGRNRGRQLGDGTRTNRSNPVDVIGLTSGVAAVRTGRNNRTCAIMRTGGLRCWPGRVGDKGLTGGVVGVSVGSYHICALTASGSVKCWGDGSDSNRWGQLGDGTTTERNTWVDVVGLNSNVAAISGARA